MVTLKGDVEGDGPIVAEVPSSTAGKEGVIIQEDWDLDHEEKARRIAEDDLNRKHKQNYKGFILLWAAWQSTGVIYGDIGTSPLYVYSSTFTAQPTWIDLVGALSIIIWSLTLIVTIKYTFIVLSADDDGQGGTFALYSLLARYAKIVRNEPHVTHTVQLERPRTGDMRPVGRNIRAFLEHSRLAQYALKVIGVLGVSMVMADGVLTPAQSVLGAIQGLKVIHPNLATSSIVGISIAILVVLFFVQPFGTSKIGTSFAPIVIIWLLFNLCSGIYNLAVHDYTVLKAFSPHYAFTYLARNGNAGWQSLGGLLLAFTGVEALFADIGAFGKRAIQLSWLCLAYPCLLFAYIGQAAYISKDTTETAFTNPFFYTVPPGSFYFSMVIAILAAVVASQAMITSSFQLLSQVMRLSYFPHIKTVHTSRKFHDQVYMPLANWLLMIGTIIVTGVYNNTTSLGNAYGVCVTIVTLITTTMVSLVVIIVWRLPSPVALLFFIVFGSLDAVYLSSVLRKVPQGAWFTLVLALILSSIFILWRWGKEQQWAAEAKDNVTPSQLLQLSPTSSIRNGEIDSQNAPQLTLTSAFGGGTLSTAAGLGIFFDKVGGGSNTIPKVFTQFLRKFKARPDVIVFFHMRPLSMPTVPLAEQFVITRATSQIPSCYRITLRHGYMDDVLTPGLGQKIVQQLEEFITRSGETGTKPRPEDLSPAIRAELDALDRAEAAQMVYVMGKQVMRIRRGGGNVVTRFFRMAMLETFLWIRENTRTKLADLDIDPDYLVEVGFVKEI
ncbi:potassium transporter [Lepidopterella palustris CBS 459.81]|uniref:Potassium transporter n=1 Tax=Lepidopterella palustris CBS 459.81 TaxID=1314670 RepID=A0A8E2JAX1_9PEZI|nr:potassium transporter [Lepidopterella palustris CBS 459.81]